MEKKALLQVIDEGDGLHFQFEGARGQVFEVISSMIEALHYEDLKRGICFKESMDDIFGGLQRARTKAFRNALERYESEVENEENKNNS